VIKRTVRSALEILIVIAIHSCRVSHRDGGRVDQEARKDCKPPAAGKEVTEFSHKAVGSAKSFLFSVFVGRVTEGLIPNTANPMIDYSHLLKVTRNLSSDQSSILPFDPRFGDRSPKPRFVSADISPDMNSDADQACVGPGGAMTAVPAEIASFVHDLRARTGLTQEKFAARLGVTFPTINRWENGRAKPSPLALKQILVLARELENERPG
jgi:DNA-binding transcriptional regulator YiaG